MGDNKGTAHAYDDVFKTMEQETPRLLIWLTNYAFEKNYTGTEKVIWEDRDLMVRDGNELKPRYMDSNFAIQDAEQVEERFHLECQSSPDAEICHRFFEYGSGNARHNVRECIADAPVYDLSNSALIQLRPMRGLGDQLAYYVRSSDGLLRHKIPVVNVWALDLDALVENRLYFLLPFLVFHYEKQLRDPEKATGVVPAFAKVKDILQEKEESGELTAFEVRTIMEMMLVVTEKLSKCEAFKEGVRDIMAGKVLDYEAKRIRDDGLREGREEGARVMVMALRKTGKDDAYIADCLENMMGYSPDQASALLRAAQ